MTDPTDRKAPMTDTATTDVEAPSDDILRKVRGLLDQAEATPFPEEAEAFSAKAMEMMTRYRIDLAMLEASKPRQDRGKVVERLLPLGSGPYVLARFDLLCSIAHASSVRPLTSRGFSGRQAHLIGYEADLDGVEVLYTSLLAQATSAAQSAKGLAARRSFLLGFSGRVGERLRDLAKATIADIEAEAEESPGVALVLADRQADADAYIARRYGRIRGSVSASSASNGSGYAAGRSAGDRADIGLSAAPAARKALS